jgi:hypothetical protein
MERSILLVLLVIICSPILFSNNMSIWKKRSSKQKKSSKKQLNQSQSKEQSFQEKDLSQNSNARVPEKDQSLYLTVIERESSSGENPETLSEREKQNIYSRQSYNKKIEIRTFQIPKFGNSIIECEDKFAVSSEDDEVLKIAISDGATESLFSDLWAKSLVDTFIKNQQDRDILDPSYIASIAEQFVNGAIIQIQGMPATRHWFMYEKLDRGTHATLAGIEFINDNKFCLITTIGDSCIFWKNKSDDVVNMQPSLKPDEFSSFPQSICHLSSTWQNLSSKIIQQEIALNNDNTNLEILLCTDALACWLSGILEKQPSIWDEVFGLSNSTDFTNFIAQLRNSHAMKNDDVTLVIINVLSINV